MLATTHDEDRLLVSYHFELVVWWWSGWKEGQVFAHCLEMRFIALRCCDADFLLFAYARVPGPTAFWAGWRSAWPDHDEGEDEDDRVATLHFVYHVSSSSRRQANKLRTLKHKQRVESMLLRARVCSQGALAAGRVRKL